MKIKKQQRNLLIVIIVLAALASPYLMSVLDYQGPVTRFKPVDFVESEVNNIYYIGTVEYDTEARGVVRLKSNIREDPILYMEGIELITCKESGGEIGGIFIVPENSTGKMLSIGPIDYIDVSENYGSVKLYHKALENETVEDPGSTPTPTTPDPEPDSPTGGAATPGYDDGIPDGVQTPLGTINTTSSLLVMALIVILTVLLLRRR